MPSLSQKCLPYLPIGQASKGTLNSPAGTHKWHRCAGSCSWCWRCTWQKLADFLYQNAHQCPLQVPANLSCRNQQASAVIESFISTYHSPTPTLVVQCARNPAWPLLVQFHRNSGSRLQHSSALLFCCLHRSPPGQRMQASLLQLSCPALGSGTYPACCLQTYAQNVKR